MSYFHIYLVVYTHRVYTKLYRSDNPFLNQAQYTSPILFFFKTSIDNLSQWIIKFIKTCALTN